VRYFNATVEDEKEYSHAIEVEEAEGVTNISVELKV